MNYALTPIVSLAFTLLFVSHEITFAVTDKPVRPTTRTYFSPNAEGLIGVTEESPFDNPADNIFHLNIDDEICVPSEVWLVYELDGVLDHTHVSRSINDQVSIGGYIVKRSRGWSVQRERIHPGWLKQGGNVIRFTVPSKATYTYRVRNVRVETIAGNVGEDEEIVFNQASAVYFGGYGYIKGFVNGSLRDSLMSLRIGSQQVRVFNGEFEGIVGLHGGDCTVEVEAVYESGRGSCHTVTFGAEERADFTFQADQAVFYKQSLAEPAREGIISLNGASLVTPANALSERTVLSITTLREIDLAPLDAGMVNVTGRHAGFRFLPNGLVFGEVARLSLTYDPSKIPDGYTEKDIRTFYFDEKTHHWVPLHTDTVISAASAIVSRTLHFTDYINGIVTVPESPEVEAHHSTSMKGIKAANPTAGVNLINPPQANSTGNASVNFPIVIPSGRNGVQPQLAVAYNSSAGNGWMGLGWSLSIPSVSIDTRWGVPRFDPEKETETYTMNGEQLTPVAHRGELQNRYASGKQFFPRIEGAFSRIIRRGDNPSNYWWEVTDKSGTRFFYGATAGGGFDKSAVLRDGEANDNGNVAYWALREVRDVNGNGVQYHYAKVMDTGAQSPNEQTGAEKGFQLYIDRITYTEFNGSGGKYDILFTRDREAAGTFTKRQDVIVTAVLGFKQVTADLLKKIDVQFDGENIRSYAFTYKTGEFYKTLLSTITEFDAEGNAFTTHSLDYYNDVRSDAGFKPLTETATDWTIPFDNIRENFVLSNEQFSDRASALSGNKSNDFSAGLSVSVTLGLRNLACKTFSIGGNYSYSQSNTEGLLSLIDINGDGLSDKVFLKDDGVRYRQNLGGGVFSQEAETITGISALYKEKSKSNNAGFEANLGQCKSIGAAINKGWNWSTSTTSAYFADVNGDNLVDFISGGNVRFNTIDPETGQVAFVTSSAGTPSPIFSGAPMMDVVTQTEEEKQEAEAQHPLHDVVRFWQAPYDGVIDVTAPVNLIASTDPARPEQPVDGVRVSIEFRNSIRWSETIGPDDYSVHTPASVSGLSVLKGDRVYFRLNSIDNGSFDQVRWNPVIEYKSDTADLSSIKDANGNPIFRFEAARDFLLTGTQTVTAPVSGVVSIDGAFRKPPTTDTVRVVVEKKSGSGVTVVIDKVFSWDEDVETQISGTGINVLEDDELSFKILSPTNLDWSRVSWKPRVVYTSAAGGIDLSTAPIEAHPVPSYSVLPHMAARPSAFVVKFKSDTTRKDSVSFVPLITIIGSYPGAPFPEISESLTFSVKKADTLLARRTLSLVNGVIADSIKSLRVLVRKGDSIFIEFDSVRLINHGALEMHAVAVSTNIETDSARITPAFYTAFRGGDPYHDIIFGSLYRGWGHFAWKTLKGSSDPIDATLLRLSDKLTDPEEPANIENPDDFDNSTAYNQAEDQFIMLTPMGKQQWWGGYDDFTYVLPEVMSSSRLGEDDLSAPMAGGGTGSFAINKISKSRAGYFSAGLSGGGPAFGASGNYSQSNGNNSVVSDFLDMNGDRYPDIVTKDKIQYTNARGGFEPEPVSHLQPEIQNSVSRSEGVSVSGKAIVSKAEPSTFNIRNVKMSVGNGENSSGLSGSFAWGRSHSSISWMDINGDGLPDRVTSDDAGNKTVALNLGYRFGAEERWNFQQIQAGESNSKSAGLGIAFGNGSVNIGVGLSQSDNFSTYALMDINGDGLPDQLIHPEKDGTTKVRMNTGNHFNDEILTWTGADHINQNSSTSESANAAFTIGIPIPPPTPVTPTIVTLYINPSGSVGHGMNREEAKFTDMNGDGFPDYVKSTADNDLRVYESNVGRTNLLRRVDRPMGGSFSVSYKRMGNTYEMPQSVWVMDSVSVFDGFSGDGPDRLVNSFEYQHPFFHRNERDFFGFRKVVTKSHDTGSSSLPVYITVEQTFRNDNYYEKGLMLHEITIDGEGRKYVEKENIYQLKDIHTGNNLPAPAAASDSGNAFPALIETWQRFYEGASDPGKATRMTYGYDSLGNVIHYTDFGDEYEDDDVSANIAYYYLSEANLNGIPKSIEVMHGGTVLRKREAIIDEHTGDVRQVRQYIDDSRVSVTDMEYDAYGNLVKLVRPENAKGQRLTLEYEFDAGVHSYVTRVTNSHGYSSEATYDLRYGHLLSTTDLNGNEVAYTIDAKGRVESVSGPYEKGGANKTISFEYHPDAEIPWALTRHFDPENPRNTLNTVIFVDGMGRVLQTKKDAAIFAGDGKPDEEVMVVSGRVYFDGLGRTVTAYFPVTSSADEARLGDFVADPDDVAPTITTYDVLNRTLTVTLPDNSTSTNQYGFGQDRDGRQQFSNLITDGNGKQSVQFTDVKGRVTSVKHVMSGESVWTSFKYNATGEQIEATDDLGHTIFSVYDNLGRRVERRHPDAGTTLYRYDLAGNITELITANLAKDGLAVQYEYDFEQLTEITYPQNPENNVRYTYGAPGAADNRAGKIVLQEDATGAQEFFYGPLGEVVKNVRTIVIPQHDEQTFVTEWQYDTWNRLIALTYPDGEKVTYSYNTGGMLRGVSGKKKNATFNYVSQLGYDKFEQRVFLAYGNGTKTSYQYEEERRRLKQVSAHTAARRMFMDNVYTYDNANNILGMKNNAPVPSPNFIGGSGDYSYSYDDLYRLSTAEGTYNAPNESQTYSLSMSYNSVGGITNKSQLHKKKGQEQKKTSYNFAYEYGDEQPHAPVHIGDYAYTYDANGNQTGWTSDISGQRRTMMWDEENRLRAVYDNGALFHYIYDAAGERILKGQTTGQRVFVNGEWKAGSGQMGNYTVYVNPYIVLRSGGYTKHYYIEGQRIVSKIGGGWDNNGQGPLKAGNGKVDYAGKGQRIFDGIVKNLKFLGADGQVLTAGKSGRVPPGQINGSGNIPESFRYFYHADHLGSTSYITDASGEVYQHVEYFAFGETFVDEHLNSDKTPFLFNGKELDEETGLYNYGGRYYDPRTSVWQSVDPLAENFAGWSPYNYTFNNPLRFIDPDGNSPKPAPPLVEAAIKALNQNIYNAFYYANNTSNWHVNEWARGRAGADADSKVKGALGEGAFYDKLSNSRPGWARLSGLNQVYFGGELYNKANMVLQVDVAQVVTTGRINLFGIRVQRDFGVVNYDASGNMRGMKMLQSQKAKTWMINYEVKTLNPFASTESLYNNLVNGINQTISRGSTRGDNILGVLVTDRAAWQRVANDPMYGPLLRQQWQRLESSGNYLRLIEGFHAEVEGAMKVLKTTIRSVPE